MRRPLPLTWMAAALAAVLLFTRLGSLPLIQPDEGRNAEIAREMKASGDWLVPTYNGLAYLDKPAFYFKIVGFSLAAFGDTEFAARLPAALFALGLLGLLYAFVRRDTDERTAALAVMVTASAPLFVIFGRIVIFDMALAFFVCGAVLASYLAESAEGNRRRAWWATAALSAGLAVLVKGPVGFILPSLVVLIFFLLEREWGAARRFFAPINLVVFFAVVLPWFFGVTARRPDFPAYGLVEETLHRYTTGAFHRTAPWYYYAPVTLGVLFPWSLLLFEGGTRALRRWRRIARTERLLLVWAVVVVLFFSTSQSKLPGYILTGAVAASVLVGRLFARAWGRRHGAAAGTVLRGAALLAVVAAVLAILTGLQAASPRFLQGAFHIRSREFDRLGTVFLPAALSLGVIALAAAGAAISRRVPVAFVAFLLFPLSLVTAAFGGLRDYAQASSSRALAASLPDLPAGTELACLRCYPNGLSFYLGRTLTVFTEEGKELTSHYVRYELRKPGPWPEGVVRLEDRDRWLAGQTRPVYLLAPSRDRDVLREIAAARDARPAELVPGWYGALLPPASGMAQGEGR